MIHRNPSDIPWTSSLLYPSHVKMLRPIYKTLHKDTFYIPPHNCWVYDNDMISRYSSLLVLGGRYLTSNKTRRRTMRLRFYSQPGISIWTTEVDYRPWVEVGIQTLCESMLSYPTHRITTRRTDMQEQLMTCILLWTDCAGQGLHGSAITDIVYLH